jgi:UDP:flavonoid glycosyltransferase YjiC (YdhE family)
LVSEDVAVSLLATFVGGWGHAEPLIPVARLAARLGHEVTFAGQAAVLPRLTEFGFETRIVGPDTLSWRRQPLQAVDRDAERTVMRDHFVTRFGGQRREALRPLLATEEPSLVVCDEVDVGAVLAAELTGVPCVTVNVIAAGGLMSPSVVGDAWNGLREQCSLADDPKCDRLAGTLMVAPVPRSFRDPTIAIPHQLCFVRPDIVARADRAPSSTRPFVYATLGTVFNVECGDLLNRLVSSMASLDADVLVTTGPHIDPAEFVGLAGHVKVEQFVSQQEVLGRCAAVVCHGGSGTLVAAVALGVPVIVLPMGADQLDNADRVEDLGVGIVLEPLAAPPSSIAHAVQTVIDDCSYQAAATELAREARQQRPLQEVDELLTMLAT